MDLAATCSPVRARMACKASQHLLKDGNRVNVHRMIHGTPNGYEAWRAKKGLVVKMDLGERRRQDARPGLATMYSLPPDRAWWPAVDAALERRVRQHWEARPRQTHQLGPKHGLAKNDSLEAKERRR